MGRIAACTAIVALVLARPCAAGLYQRDVLGAYEINQDGYAIAPEIDVFLTMVNIIKKPDNLENDEAREILRSIREREKKGIASLKPEEQLALYADMLRLRRDMQERNRAFEGLRSMLRSLRGEYQFILYSDLAHASMLNGNYADACEYYASVDCEFPPNFLGLTPQQLSWYKRLETEYYHPFLKHRARETLVKNRDPAQDTLDPIFTNEKRGKGEPVRFVGESGAFEAGTIAATERAKLPPDAIAIVQQMILWSPDDGRLWWLLAELYNAAGDEKSSARAFRICNVETKYSNPVVRQHETVVAAAAEEQAAADKARRESELAKQKEQQQQLDAERKKNILLAAALILAALLIAGYWQWREFARRAQARRARVALQTRQSG
jgi:hypothetical protein